MENEWLLGVNYTNESKGLHTLLLLAEWSSKRMSIFNNRLHLGSHNNAIFYL